MLTFNLGKSLKNEEIDPKTFLEVKLEIDNACEEMKERWMTQEAI